jgi:hypothetical protein
MYVCTRFREEQLAQFDSCAADFEKLKCSDDLLRAKEASLALERDVNNQLVLLANSLKGVLKKVKTGWTAGWTLFNDDEDKPPQSAGNNSSDSGSGSGGGISPLNKTKSSSTLGKIASAMLNIGDMPSAPFSSKSSGGGSSGSNGNSASSAPDTPNGGQGGGGGSGAKKSSGQGAGGDSLFAKAAKAADSTYRSTSQAMDKASAAASSVSAKIVAGSPFQEKEEELW